MDLVECSSDIKLSVETMKEYINWLADHKEAVEIIRLRGSAVVVIQGKIIEFYTFPAK